MYFIHFSDTVAQLNFRNDNVENDLKLDLGLVF